MKNLKEQLKRQLKEKKRRKKQVLLPASKPSPRVEMQYRRALQAQVKLVTQLLKQEIFPILEGRSIEYRKDASIMSVIQSKSEEVLGLYRGRAITAGLLASEFVTGSSKHSSDSLARGLNGQIESPDLARIISEEGLQRTLELKIAENTALIKTIPTQYLDQVEQALLRNLAGGATPFGLKREIYIIQRKTLARVKFIARDQTAKTNAAITQARQTALGVREYKWVTSADERVRDSHRSKNGKVFRWSDPPKDTGHPGTDYNCRCTSRAIIDFNN